MDAIKQACKILGGNNKLAVLLEVTPGMVSQWVTGHRRIPAERCPTIERATSGEVRCEDLRPDVDWGYLRGTTPIDKILNTTAAHLGIERGG